MEVPGMTYGLLATADGDQQDATFGGIVQIRSAEETPRWMPYFGVEDADATVARAQESGGSVLMPASDVPDVGRIAWLADAFGAPFAVIKPMPLSLTAVRGPGPKCAAAAPNPARPISRRCGVCLTRCRCCRSATCTRPTAGIGYCAGPTSNC
ncbi:hypothetical protein GCM10020000_76710 [Streptomyces olivoverticillatus]